MLHKNALKSSFCSSNSLYSSIAHNKVRIQVYRYDFSYFDPPPAIEFVLVRVTKLSRQWVINNVAFYQPHSCIRTKGACEWIIYTGCFLFFYCIAPITSFLVSFRRVYYIFMYVRMHKLKSSRLYKSQTKQEYKIIGLHVVSRSLSFKAQINPFTMIQIFVPIKQVDHEETEGKHDTGYLVDPRNGI